MPLAPGVCVGPYEVNAQVGVGGMGEVWRATDKNLGRQVAIKVLPEAFAQSAERLARLEREAKTLASLNHPNIAIIHGLERAAGAPAIVMELVEGPTLADCVAKGPVPVDDALPIAKQISEALEAAHEQGIVHRDLKPANVKVRQDGTVKVLDFGLAKALEPLSSPGADVTASPTITSPAMTQLGIILGTAAYMSPEQAKGRQADKRSDVWAFGAVLYEMLSGQRAFKGDDISDTLAAVLRQDVDWTALPASTPAPVRRLIARCLDRDVKRRLRDIGEARIVLDDPNGRAGDGRDLRIDVPPKPFWRRATPVVLSAVVAGVLASAATVYFTPSPAPLVVTRLSFTPGEGHQIATAGGGKGIAISPDGAHVAYTATAPNAAGTIEQRLYVRSMSGLEARPLTDWIVIGRGFIGGLAFSPDSRSVAFWSRADQTLKRVGVGGGPAVPICRADQPAGLSWGPDGIVFGQPSKGIMRVSAKGGEPELLVSLKDGEQAYGPQILPGGETVLFTLASGIGGDLWERSKIVAHSLRSGERKTLVDAGSDARYVPTGHLVYAVGGVVFSVAMDLRRLEPTGEHVPIVEGVRRAPANTSVTAHFDFSNTGSLVYLPGPISPATGSQSDLALVDRKGGVTPLKLPPGPYQHPRAAPTGTRIVFASDDGKEANVWTYDLRTPASQPTRLTFAGKNRFPIWSADGQRVAFQSDREGDAGIFWQPVNGGIAERLTKPEPGSAHVPESWSPKDELLLFAAIKGSNVSLWSYSLQDRKATPFADVQSPNRINAAFSPGGRWFAYNVAEGAMNTVYVQPFPPTGAKHQISRTSTVHPVWSRDGRELITQPPGGIQWDVQTITTGPSFAPSAPKPWPRGGTLVFGPAGQRNYDVMLDGRILGVIPAGKAPSAGSSAQEIQVVLNWFEELRRLVPGK